MNNYPHLIVDSDYFTKWLEDDPIREKAALTVATFLYELMCRYCCLKVKINDQGREFVNETFLISHTFWLTDRG